MTEDAFSRITANNHEAAVQKLEKLITADDPKTVGEIDDLATAIEKYEQAHIPITQRLRDAVPGELPRLTPRDLGRAKRSKRPELPTFEEE